MLTGYYEEEKRKFDISHQLLAWHVSIVANTRGNLKRNQQLSPDKLIERSKKERKVMTKEQKKQALQKIYDKIGVKVDERGHVIKDLEVKETQQEKSDFQFDESFTIHTPDELTDKRRKRGVYLIKAENGLIKIGRTIDLKDRLMELQTGSATELSLELFLETELEKELEKKLHERFKEKRVRGEWFKLSKSDLKWIKSLKEKHT